MKKFESADELKVWEEYREFSKASLKLVDGDTPCFVSKDKLDFTVAGKPWSGHAFLAGKHGVITVKLLKKEGVLFKEGQCRLEGKDLLVRDLPGKLAKEATKTVMKLHLGYKVVVQSEESASVPGDGNGAATAAPRGKKLEELKELEANLDRLLAVLHR
jgi:hypothetical protein